MSQDRRPERQPQIAERKRLRRAAWIELKGGKCVECGSTENLEVDHIDPSTKLYQPKTVWGLGTEIRERELAKCQVLCRKCHRAKTNAELSGWEHGVKITGYHKGCRCDLCKAANKAYRLSKK